MISPSALVKYAKKFLGVPYVFGGTTPKGFDCSGLVQYVYRHFGINISRTTRTQINDGREVGRNNLQLGDLVFPSSGHVTLYIGNNQVLHAPEPGDRVKISPLWKFWRATRILPDENRNPTPNPTPVPIPIKPGTFTLHTSTALHRTDDNFEFLVGDYNHNRRPDVYCIKKNGTGSGKTEVHILNGENNYQNFLLQTPTALHETDGNWQFCLGDYNHDRCLDLYCIAKRNTGSHSTEVHILSGKSNFSEFILHTGTILHETDENWKFCLGDYNNNGCLDLYCIPRRNTIIFEILILNLLKYMFYQEKKISKIFYYIQEQNYMRLMKIGILDYQEKIYVALLKEVQELEPLKCIFQMEIIISRIFCSKQELIYMKQEKIFVFMHTETLFLLFLKMELVIQLKFIA